MPAMGSPILAALDRCSWPAVSQPYRDALTAAVRFALSRYEPAAIVVAGSVARGEPGPTSDVDLLVIHDRPERQWVHRTFHGVPTELFVNAPEHFERYFASEGWDEGGRPFHAHMLARGSVVYIAPGREGDLAALRAKAAAAVETSPAPSETFLNERRYNAITALEDGQDAAVDAAADPAQSAQATALLCKAVGLAVELAFWTAHQWQPSDKRSLRALAALDPRLGELACAFYGAATLEERLMLGREIVARATGFSAAAAFEWETPLA
jgi:predicted nucleotidyltransferase